MRGFRRCWRSLAQAVEWIAAADGGTLEQARQSVARYCAGAGAGRYFVSVYGGNSFSTKKPDPLGVRTILQETGVAADEALMIGDSSIDVLTGRNAGMWTCGVTYGFCSAIAGRGAAGCAGRKSARTGGVVALAAVEHGFFRRKETRPRLFSFAHVRTRYFIPKHCPILLPSSDSAIRVSAPKVWMREIWDEE